VNIFGGIVNCATVAQGILDDAKEVWGKCRERDRQRTVRGRERARRRVGEG
jgi:succinyl-CoA synthetase beta subunit